MIDFNLLNLFSASRSVLKKKDKIKTLVRMLKIEVSYNLNLIKCLNNEKLNQQDFELLEIISKLKYDVLQMFLIESKETKNILDLLKENFIDVDEETDNLICNVIQKIMILKSICELKFDTVNNNYVDFRLLTRIENLKDKLILLNKKLVNIN